MELSLCFGSRDVQKRIEENMAPMARLRDCDICLEKISSNIVMPLGLIVVVLRYLVRTINMIVCDVTALFDYFCQTNIKIS